MKTTIIGMLVAAMLAMPAQAASPLSDQSLLEDIARDTSMSPCAVRRVLGDDLAIVAQQYVANPSARGRIKRAIRRHYDAWLAEQPEPRAGGVSSICERTAADLAGSSNLPMPDGIQRRDAALRGVVIASSRA